MWRFVLVISVLLLVPLTLASRRRSGRERATAVASRATAPPGATDSSVSFTAHESIVPGKLTVDIYLHTLESSDGPISCWTYVSSGLWPLGQKEIAFTVKRRPSESETDYPRDLLKFYELVRGLAVQGRLVDISGNTTLSPTGAGLLGRKDFRGVLYAPPLALKGVEIHVPWLTALILTTNELTVAREYGMIRLMTILGSRYRFFPTAPWADRDRPELVAPHDMESSLLSKSARSPLDAASVRLETKPSRRTSFPGPGGLTDQSIELGPKRIVLRIRPTAKGPLKELMARRAADAPFTLLTGPDPSADAYVKWQTGQKAFSAISKPGAAGTIIGANFITFVPQQQEDGGLAIEDGFGVLLRDESWQRLRASLSNGEPISIQSKGDRMSFQVVWAPEVEPDFADPIESQFPSGWEEFDRSGASATDRSKSSFLRNIVFLTTDDVMSRRIDIKPFSVHVKALEAVVESHFTKQASRQGMDLALSAELQPNGVHDLQLLTRPEANAQHVQDLKQALMQVRPPPSFFGPVRFQLNFSVWGGSASPPAAARQP